MEPLCRAAWRANAAPLRARGHCVAVACQRAAAELGADACPPLAPRADLEPLVLSDPQAQRAVTDFMRADSSGAGVLTTAGAAGAGPPLCRPQAAAPARLPPLCADAAAAAPPRTRPLDFARTFRLDDDLFLRRLVALFDLDGDGGVALNEFLGACQRRGAPRAPRRVPRLPTSCGARGACSAPRSASRRAS